MIPILITAFEHERRYIKYKFQHSVDYFIRNVDFYKKMNHAIVLFGSCGAFDLWNLARVDLLMSPDSWCDFQGSAISTIYPDEIISMTKCAGGFTASHSIHDPDETEELRRGLGCAIVDQETTKIGRICRDAGIPWQSIRYIIDGCDKKVMPPVINHFWRKHQHKRMQLKMEALLNESIV